LNLTASPSIDRASLRFETKQRDRELFLGGEYEWKSVKPALWQIFSSRVCWFFFLMTGALLILFVGT
jgi:hypothetical protein